VDGHRVLTELNDSAHIQSTKHEIIAAPFLLLNAELSHSALAAPEPKSVLTESLFWLSLQSLFPILVVLAKTGLW
jgi:hypothetical protein